MTAATYTTNLAHIFRDEAITNWSAIGTGGAGLSAETDYYIQGVSCVSKAAFAASTKGMIYNFGSDAGGSGTDGAYIAWMSHTAPNSLATKAAGGMQFLIGSATGAYKQFYVGGSDTLTFLKWELVAVNETISPSATTGSPGIGVEQYFGGLWNLPSGGPTKGAPNVMDGIRFGRCDIVILGGTGVDPEATFDGVTASLETASLRYGLLTQRQAGGVFENSGLIQFGQTATPCEFLDSNKTIFLRAHDHVTTNFHTWDANNAATIVTFNNLTVTALGGASIGRWRTNNNATLNWTSCTFTGMGTFTFGTNSTILGCVFRSCGLITPNVANMSGCTFATPTVAANGHSIIWTSVTNTDGKLDNTTFSKGAAAHHAMYIEASSISYTLRGVHFSGFSASNDVDGSAIRVLAAFANVSINLVGCTNDGSGFSLDTRGSTFAVTIVIDPVTLSLNVKTPEGANLQNAYVLMETAEAGDEPYQDSISITQAAGVATVTHTAHGLKTGDYTVIRGAQPDGYNKIAQITVTGVNSYTYTCNSGLSSPATGTPVASFVPVHGYTDASGNISGTRTWTASQAVKGWARKASGSPYYKPNEFAGTVNSLTGLSINIKMISDE